MSAPSQSAYPPPGYGAGPPAGNTAVIRSVGRCFVLLLFSGGLWAFAWMYHTAKEVSVHVRQPPPSPGARAGLYIIPIYNLVLQFQTWEDINHYCQRARSQDFNVVLLFILSFFVSFITYPIVQMRLNDAHRAATNGAATNAPMETIDWVLLGIGLVFWCGGWLVFILAVIVAAGSSTA